MIDAIFNINFSHIPLSSNIYKNKHSTLTFS